MSSIPKIASLTVLKLDGTLGASYPLNHDHTRVVMIGRDPSCDIRISLSKVSRNHARVDVEKDEYGKNCIWFTSLSKKQGTYLNREVISPMEMIELHHEDEICIGGRLFRFNYMEGENPREKKRFLTPISVRSKPLKTPLSSILSPRSASKRRISFAHSIEDVRVYTPHSKPVDFIESNSKVEKQFPEQVTEDEPIESIKPCELNFEEPNEIENHDEIIIQSNTNSEEEIEITNSQESDIEQKTADNEKDIEMRISLKHNTQQIKSEIEQTQLVEESMIEIKANDEIQIVTSPNLKRKREEYINFLSSKKQKIEEIEPNENIPPSNIEQQLSFKEDPKAEISSQQILENPFQQTPRRSARIQRKLEQQQAQDLRNQQTQQSEAISKRSKRKQTLRV